MKQISNDTLGNLIISMKQISNDTLGNLIISMDKQGIYISREKCSVSLTEEECDELQSVILKFKALRVEDIDRRIPGVGC